MGRTDKGMTAFLDLRTKIPNKKQSSRFSITDIINQDFRKSIKKFKNNCIQVKRVNRLIVNQLIITSS